MFRTLTHAMSATLTEKDGPTIPDVIEHLAESALDTLSKPSDPVISAGTWELGRRGYTTMRYEDFAAAFVEAIKAARRD